MTLFTSNKIKSQRGISMVEIVVASAIIASFVAVIGIYATLSTFSLRTLPKTQAAMLAQEGVEIVRSLRDTSYANRIANLSNNTDYYANWSQASSSYALTTSKSAIDNTFYRTIQMKAVYRDGAYNIANSGTLDADTKKAVVTVSWREGNATSTHVLETYVFDTFNN